MAHIYLVANKFHAPNAISVKGAGVSTATMEGINDLTTDNEYTADNASDYDDISKCTAENASARLIRSVADDASGESLDLIDEGTNQYGLDNDATVMTRFYMSAHWTML